MLDSEHKDKAKRLYGKTWKSFFASKISMPLSTCKHDGYEVESGRLFETNIILITKSDVVSHKVVQHRKKIIVYDKLETSYELKQQKLSKQSICRIL